MTESETSWETEAIQQQIKKQSRYHGWQLFDQDDSLRRKIGSILHSKEIESDSNVDIFSPEERHQVEAVFQKIRQLIPPPNGINFGCTFVTVYKNRRLDEELILFRCTLPNKKIFIQQNGRTYVNWDDFIESNQIENGCEYFAPSDGVYATDGQIWKFKKQTSTYLDGAFIVALFVGVALDIPVISTGISVAMYLYGACRSISTLIDRYKHKETTNSETIFSYLILLTICCTQLCIAMVSCKEYLFRKFGIHWCKLVLSTINGTVLCLDAIGFVISLSRLYTKAEKFTMSDTFSLLLQAFLLYEQAINTIEFLELLSDTGYFRSFQKMSKSQKRNWRKRRSKELKRGDSKNKIFEYQNDFFRWMRWFGHQVLSRSGEFLMKNFVQSMMSFAGAIIAGVMANAWRQNRL